MGAEVGLHDAARTGWIGTNAKFIDTDANFFS